MSNEKREEERERERERERKRSSINPQSTIPLRDPPGSSEYIHYASLRRSYVRAIEKTVSSLIPPTATFRLPAAWWRIGSGGWGEREEKDSHR